jgi:hypothetical protein
MSIHPPSSALNISTKPMLFRDRVILPICALTASSLQSSLRKKILADQIFILLYKHRVKSSRPSDSGTINETSNGYKDRVLKMCDI